MPNNYYDTVDKYVRMFEMSGHLPKKEKKRKVHASPYYSSAEQSQQYPHHHSQNHNQQNINSTTDDDSARQRCTKNKCVHKSLHNRSDNNNPNIACEKRQKVAAGVEKVEKEATRESQSGAHCRSLQKKSLHELQAKNICLKNQKSSSNKICKNSDERIQWESCIENLEQAEQRLAAGTKKHRTPGTLTQKIKTELHYDDSCLSKTTRKVLDNKTSTNELLWVNPKYLDKRHHVIAIPKENKTSSMEVPIATYIRNQKQLKMKRNKRHGEKYFFDKDLNYKRILHEKSFSLNLHHHASGYDDDMGDPQIMHKEMSAEERKLLGLYPGPPYPSKCKFPTNSVTDFGALRVIASEPKTRNKGAEKLGTNISTTASRSDGLLFQLGIYSGSELSEQSTPRGGGASESTISEIKVESDCSVKSCTENETTESDAAQAGSPFPPVTNSTDPIITYVLNKETRSIPSSQTIMDQYVNFRNILDFSSDMENDTTDSTVRIQEISSIDDLALSDYEDNSANAFPTIKMSRRDIEDRDDIVPYDEKEWEQIALGHEYFEKQIALKQQNAKEIFRKKSLEVILEKEDSETRSVERKENEYLYNHNLKARGKRKCALTPKKGKSKTNCVNQKSASPFVKENLSETSLGKQKSALTFVKENSSETSLSNQKSAATFVKENSSETNLGNQKYALTSIKEISSETSLGKQQSAATFVKKISSETTFDKQNSATTFVKENSDTSFENQKYEETLEKENSERILDKLKREATYVKEDDTIPIPEDLGNPSVFFPDMIPSPSFVLKMGEDAVIIEAENNNEIIVAAEEEKPCKIENNIDIEYKSPNTEEFYKEMEKWCQLVNCNIFRRNINGPGLKTYMEFSEKDNKEASQSPKSDLTLFEELYKKYISDQGQSVAKTKDLEGNIVENTVLSKISSEKIPEVNNTSNEKSSVNCIYKSPGNPEDFPLQVIPDGESECEVDFGQPILTKNWLYNFLLKQSSIEFNDETESDTTSNENLEYLQRENDYFVNSTSTECDLDNDQISSIDTSPVENLKMADSVEFDETGQGYWMEPIIDWENIPPYMVYNLMKMTGGFLKDVYSQESLQENFNCYPGPGNENTYTSVFTPANLQVQQPSVTVCSIEEINTTEDEEDTPETPSDITVIENTLSTCTQEDLQEETSVVQFPSCSSKENIQLTSKSDNVDFVDNTENYDGPKKRQNNKTKGHHQNNQGRRKLPRRIAFNLYTKLRIMKSSLSRMMTGMKNYLTVKGVIRKISPLGTPVGNGHKKKSRISVIYKAPTTFFHTASADNLLSQQQKSGKDSAMPIKKPNSSI